MQYIVIDLEWNQASRLPGNIDPPYPLTGEIIQIGAVKLDAQRNIVDHFQQVVKPVYYRVMNPNVQALTGIEDALLNTGIPFSDAVTRLQTWAGEEAVYFSWGLDDRLVLKENLELFALPAEMTALWCDLQMIYRFQVDGSVNQAALKTAMDTLELTAPDNIGEAHNAFFDAYCAGMIAGKLDLEQGVLQVKKYAEEHPPKTPSFLVRETVRGCESFHAAYEAGKEIALTCPRCGAPLLNERPWFCEKKGRPAFITLQSCSNTQCKVRKRRTEYFVRLKLVKNMTKKWQAILLVYSATNGFISKYIMRKREAEQKNNPIA